MKSIIKSFFIIASISFVAGGIIQPQDNEIIARSSDDTNWKIMSNVISDCESGDISEVMTCLGVKAVTVLDRAARMGNIDVISGISLIRNQEIPEDSRNGRALMTEEQVQNGLPQDPTMRTSRLIDLIYEGAIKFLETHTLQFKMPENGAQNLARALEEGRGKLKKKLFPILMLVGLKMFALIPIIIGVIGLVAAKALIVGKLALIIAGVIAIQKFISGGGSSGFGGFGKVTDSYGSGGSSGGWSSGGSSASSGGYTYKRSFDDAQKMAYVAQIPADATE